MNRRRVTLVAAFALLTPAVGSAQAIGCQNSSLRATSALVVAATPTVTVCANGSLYSFPVATKGPIGVLDRVDQLLGNGASFYVSANFDADPYSIFTFGSVLPSGLGPMSFDAYFTTPVMPGSYTMASSSGTLGVTAAGRTAVGTVSMGTYPYYISGYADAMNLGVDTGSGNCTVASGGTTNSISCDPPGAMNTFSPISPLLLTAHLSYTQTTTGVGSSSVGWTGAVTLDATTTTPEPATFGLMATGLALLAGGAWRRRRA